MAARVPTYADTPPRRFPRRLWIFFKPHPEKAGEYEVKVFTNKRKAFDFMSATPDGKEMKLHIHEF